MHDYYEPMLEKYQYHYAHMKILSRQQTNLERREAFENDKDSIFTERDYAEAISVRLGGEIQPDNFGFIPKIIMEGSTCMFHNPLTNQIETNFFTHFSDDAKQHASTSYQNMTEKLKTLHTNGILNVNSTIYDHTDGCSCQYRS